MFGCRRGFGSTSAPGRFRTGLRPTPDRREIDPRSTPARPRIDPGSTPNRRHLDRGSTPYGALFGPRSTSRVAATQWSAATAWRCGGMDVAVRRAAAIPWLAAAPGSALTPWAAAIPQAPAGAHAAQASGGQANMRMCPAVFELVRSRSQQPSIGPAHPQVFVSPSRESYTGLSSGIVFATPRQRLFRHHAHLMSPLSPQHRHPGSPELVGLPGPRGSPEFDGPSWPEGSLEPMGSSLPATLFQTGTLRTHTPKHSVWSFRAG